MQLAIDWMRRERCALQTDTALAEIGVCGAQRAAVYLVQRHPRRQTVDAEQHVYSLTISYRAASAWLARNCELRYGLMVTHSSLIRAVACWRERGIMATARGRRTTLVLDGARLIAWHAAEQVSLETSLARFESGAARCNVVRGGASSMNERVKEDVNQKKNLNHSFTGSSARELLEGLPACVFDRRLSNDDLLASIDHWRQTAAEGPHSREDIVGAVLAARESAGGDPHAYAATCLSRGVIYKFEKAARALIGECQRAAQTQQVLTRPKRSHRNVLRELHAAERTPQPKPSAPLGREE